MTNVELTERKNIVATMMRQCKEAGVEIPDEIEKLYSQYQCIGMINSVLAYNFDLASTAENLLNWELNRYRSYLKEYVDIFGHEKVKKLIQNQIDDIDHIEYNVAVDDDYIHYNNIIWKKKENVA